MSLTITNNNFKKEVLESKIPVLVDFWANWCGPCKMFTPIIEQLAEEESDNVKVGKIDIDVEMELAEQYKVMSIPTVLVFQDGKEIHRSVGVKDKNQLKAILGI